MRRSEKGMRRIVQPHSFPLPPPLWGGVLLLFRSFAWVWGLTASTALPKACIPCVFTVSRPACRAGDTVALRVAPKVRSLRPGRRTCAGRKWRVQGGRRPALSAYISHPLGAVAVEFSGFASETGSAPGHPLGPGNVNTSAFTRSALRYSI